MATRGSLDNQGSVHIDEFLTNFALELPRDQGMLADTLSPQVGVKKESDLYLVYNRDSLKDRDVERAMGAEANEFRFTYSDDSYACKEKSIKTPLHKRQLDNADKEYQLEKEATRQCHEILALQRERRIALQVQTGSNWATSSTPSTKWDASGADIKGDVRAAAKAFHLKAGLFPNSAVISVNVYDAILEWLFNEPSDTTILDARKLDPSMERSGLITQFSGLFGVRDWYVGLQLRDSAADGESFSGAYIWQDDCTLLYLNPNAGWLDHTALKTFRSEDYTVMKYDKVETKSKYIEESHVISEKIVSNVLGYHLDSVLT